jgi:hypothetical protein
VLLGRVVALLAHSRVLVQASSLGVPRSAPRLSAQLVAATANVDDGRKPIAETYRQVAAVAEALGLSRPSYESIRRVTHELRARKRDPTIGQVLLDINTRRRPPEAIVSVLAGTAPRLPK